MVNYVHIVIALRCISLIGHHQSPEPVHHQNSHVQIDLSVLDVPLNTNQSINQLTNQLKTSYLPFADFTSQCTVDAYR